MCARYANSRNVKLRRLYTCVVELGFIPLSVVGIVFIIRAIRHLAGDWQSQRAWALIGGGLVFYGIADGIWAWYVIVGTSAPFPSVADAFYLTSMILLVLGVIRFPTGPLSRQEYVRYWIDGAILLTGSIALVGYMVIGRESLIRGALTLDSVLVLAHPYMDLMLILAILLMILRRPRPGKIGMLTILAAGVIIVAAGNFWWIYLEARGSYVTHAPTYALWMIGYALMVASLHRRADMVRTVLCDC